MQGFHALIAHPASVFIVRTQNAEYRLTPLINEPVSTIKAFALRALL